MKYTKNASVIALASLFLLGCSTATEQYSKAIQASPEHCQFGDVVLQDSFQQGRIDDCEQREDGTIVVMTGPENQPINPSPWYAFKVSSATPQTVAFEILALEKGRARYNPKVSSDRQSWDEIEHSKGDHSIYFELDVGPEQKWVAGQELFDNDDYLAWLNELAAEHNLEQFTIGYSAQNRDLPALVSRGSGKEWLILIGRQHPPELTGAIAMRDFVETVLAQGDEFLERYNVLIAPNLNPDGVALGNWRHSTGGGDLNRDWFARSQPETTAVHTYLEQLREAGDTLVYALDFHSTWRNVYYTIPVDYLENEPTFSRDWLQLLAEKIPYEVDEAPGSTPDRGIFKQYMADEHGIHSVTYEVGDETDREEISVTARAAAQALMEYMLARD